MFKKMTVFLIAFALLFWDGIIVPASAIENNAEIGFIEYPQESNLPHNGSDHFYNEYSEKSTQREVIYTPVHGFDYIKGTTKYGSWRNGVSGGSDIADITLTFDRGYNEEYNISFTATLTGEFTSTYLDTISAELGVEVGASESYSLGSGVSVTVPKGKRYLIRYRPVYNTYTVVDTIYLEAYIPGYGWDRIKSSSKTCYVDVFSHWDFTVVEASSDGSLIIP